jgi:hypothetical protein
MSLETSLANIVIRDNTIDQGRFSDGTTPVAYTYAYHAWILGSSFISGNTFAAPTASTDMLYIDNCSCTITGNKFIRGSTSIGSYIRNAGNDQIIKNNTFDSTTVDGSSETLVAGTLTTSNYYGNKNQTIYIPIHLASYTTKVVTDVASTPNGAFSVNAVTGGVNFGIVDGKTLQLIIGNTTASYFQTNVNLTSLLPEGIKILAVKYGGFKANSGAPVLNGIASNEYQLTLRVYDTVKANYTIGTSSIMDIQNTQNSTVAILNHTSYNLNTGLVALGASTQYSEIDTSANIYCVTSQNYIIVAIFTCFVLMTSGVLTLTFSPMVVKCRW